MGSHFSFVTIAGVVYLHSSITSSNPGLKLADASLVTPLLIFSPVFTTLISAVFLSETPSARGWLGVGLVLVGTYWLNRNLGTDWLAPLKSLALRLFCPQDCCARSHHCLKKQPLCIRNPRARALRRSWQPRF